MVIQAPSFHHDDSAIFNVCPQGGYGDRHRLVIQKGEKRKGSLLGSFYGPALEVTISLRQRRLGNAVQPCAREEENMGLVSARVHSSGHQILISSFLPYIDHSILSLPKETT